MDPVFLRARAHVCRPRGRATARGRPALALVVERLHLAPRAATRGGRVRVHAIELRVAGERTGALVDEVLDRSILPADDLAVGPARTVREQAIVLEHRCGD